MEEDDNIPMEENDIPSKEGIEDVLLQMHNIGINCGREISRMAKMMHSDCVAIIPLYRSCIVIMQSEEEKEKGECTIHSYGDPHWLGGDINIETLKKDEFHSKFKIHGQRSGPELIFENDDKSALLPIDRGFKIIEMAEKYIEGTLKNLGVDIRSGYIRENIDDENEKQNDV